MAGLEGILWLLFLIDAIFANLTVIFWKKRWKKAGISKWLPLHPLWTALYLFLVVWLGFALYRLGLFSNFFIT